MPDSNPRPPERCREDADQSDGLPGSSTLRPIPPEHLLLNLPTLLIHPPYHPLHLQSLALSLTSLRKCLAHDALDPDVECKAWSSLAEVGMMVVKAGVTRMAPIPKWAEGVENEVEKAIGKGLILARKHPTLRWHKYQLTLLHASLAHGVHANTKFARSLLKRLMSSSQPKDPPHLVYAAHLALIDSFISPAGSLVFSTSPSGDLSVAHTPSISHQDLQSALAAVHALRSLAGDNDHARVILLTYVLLLQILVTTGTWDQVADALAETETALGLSYVPVVNSRAKSQTPGQPSTNPSLPSPAQPTTFITFTDPLESCLAIHTLVLSVLWFTHVGQAEEAAPRLSHLHALLDEGAACAVKLGIVEIGFPNSPPLVLQTTHPRILYLLGFLVSATAKRDAVGRKPKRKIFAAQGLSVLEKEEAKHIPLPTGASVQTLRNVHVTTTGIKADLLTELIGVSILRSEFCSAKENLDLLIAHTRNYDLFPAYASRITLHHAHLAHALGQTERARDCYRVAEHLALDGNGDADVWVKMAAVIGGIGLEMGLKHGRGGGGKDKEDNDWQMEELKKRAAEAIEACAGMGATLQAGAKVIEGCMVDESLGAKQRFKTALDLASQSQDNHLRALILALVASHFLHTDGVQAMGILATCNQLAAGLGAAPNKSDGAGNAVGNAPLRLWVGERLLELYKRAGKESVAEKQAVANANLRALVGQCDG